MTSPPPCIFCTMPVHWESPRVTCASNCGKTTHAICLHYVLGVDPKFGWTCSNCRDGRPYNRDFDPNISLRHGRSRSRAISSQNGYYADNRLSALLDTDEEDVTAHKKRKEARRVNGSTTTTTTNAVIARMSATSLPSAATYPSTTAPSQVRSPKKKSLMMMMAGDSSIMTESDASSGVGPKRSRTTSSKLDTDDSLNMDIRSSPIKRKGAKSLSVVDDDMLRTQTPASLSLDRESITTAFRTLTPLSDELPASSSATTLTALSRPPRRAAALKVVNYCSDNSPVPEATTPTPSHSSQQRNGNGHVKSSLSSRTRRVVLTSIDVTRIEEQYRDSTGRPLLHKLHLLPITPCSTNCDHHHQDNNNTIANASGAIPSTRFVGVSKRRERWVCVVDNEYVGSYPSEMLAAIAYSRATMNPAYVGVQRAQKAVQEALEMRGQWASCNVIDKAKWYDPATAAATSSSSTLLPEM